MKRPRADSGPAAEAAEAAGPEEEKLEAPAAAALEERKQDEAGEATGLVYDQRMLLHESPGAHPERARRVVTIYERLQAEGLSERCVEVAAREAVDEELLLVHRPSYVRRMDELEAGEDSHRASASQEFESVYVSKHTLHSARVAAGGVIELTRAVMEGRVANGVAVVRPPGHHAEAHCPMGFCILNNVAIAAAVARARLGAQRVLIVDWDIHFGNGTYRAFNKDPSVLYASVHRFDRGQFFPRDASGSARSVGVGEGRGYSVNVAWNGPKATDGDYASAWARVFMPVFRAFAPDLVLISAGFDAGAADPIGQCLVSPGGFAWMTRQLMTLAHGRVVLALEGGYAVNVLARSAAACTHALLGGAVPSAEEFDPPSAAATSAIDLTVAHQRPFWALP